MSKLIWHDFFCLLESLERITLLKWSENILLKKKMLKNVIFTNYRNALYKRPCYKKDFRLWSQRISAKNMDFYLM